MPYCEYRLHLLAISSILMLLLDTSWMNTAYVTVYIHTHIVCGYTCKKLVFNCSMLLLAEIRPVHWVTFIFNIYVGPCDIYILPNAILSQDIISKVSLLIIS